MLREMPDQAMREQWQRTFAEYGGKLRPNRKSGAELAAYLQAKYAPQLLHDHWAEQVICANVLENQFYRDKLPEGAAPQPLAFSLQLRGKEVFVGVELLSGHFHVEDDEQLWDELFAYRGLDEADLQNPYLIYEYVNCLKKCGRLEQALSSCR